MMESLCLTEEMVDCTLTAGRTSFSAHRMVGLAMIRIMMFIGGIKKQLSI